MTFFYSEADLQFMEKQRQQLANQSKPVEPDPAISTLVSGGAVDHIWDMVRLAARDNG